MDIQTIRMHEKESHEKIYSEKSLYEEGSWLAKPVKTVMDSLEVISNDEITVLDLGCGVGRNSIAIAQYYKEKGIVCNIDCVDLLKMAIDKLQENSIKFGVEEQINCYVSTIENYEITKEKYDYIIAVSAIEHVADELAFQKTLMAMRDGIKSNGKVIIVMNSEVKETTAEGNALEPMFEVNIATTKLQNMIHTIFGKWTFEKETVVPQEWWIPRDGDDVKMNTNVVTFVMKKAVIQF